ncbi:hypothetical protein Sfulv_16120 [Streptomyces fulvorobeus]|uniref:Uncharacterized protein n=1 Tax=Streptomyces fulvorobeus TaxID=284028 RepID=A0A7J0C2U7_9ACTN|nr:hypothetical protein Sfulv_16120 [Streptomyces fulvorobeus]
MGAVVDAREELGHQCPARAGDRLRVGVRRRALAGDGVRVQQVARFLRDQADLAYQVAGAGGAGVRPPTVTVPVVGSTMPTRVARSVDFPAPLRPMRAMVSPGVMRRSMRRRASVRPRRTPRRVALAVSVLPGPGAGWRGGGAGGG